MATGMYDSLDVYHRTAFGVIQSVELFRRGVNESYNETGVFYILLII